MNRYCTAISGLLFPGLAVASSTGDGQLDLTGSMVGYGALAIFIVAYLFVMSEEFTHLRKSKPVILAAGVIWASIAAVYTGSGDNHIVESALRHNLLEFSELFLFLLAAMTYVNTMDERNVFEALRSLLVRRGFSYRSLFWLTGLLAFFLSPILDNLTTALVMCAVLLAVGKDNPRFVSIGCINIVVAANAGGAFSPFGDITTLMVWQKGLIDFYTFFLLFIPSVVNFLVPAAIMHFAIPSGNPAASTEQVFMRRGAKRIMLLFACTIATAVSFHNFLHLPPFLGMMTGLAYLQIFGYYLKRTHKPALVDGKYVGSIGDVTPVGVQDQMFDFFNRLARAEWDTLLFFYGVVLCVGALGFIGYLAMASESLYINAGPTFANIAVGVLSAIVDNIPVMFAVLSMNPGMELGQWLLVTLTAGVGGSLLSIGSAAGVALMGQARGKYTFFSHLRWTPVIALGYAASIMVHMWVNADSFNVPIT
ncbi:MAG TPA: sodium:proton antiporter NhaD [Gammaproteobacteria bacterium]|nr:sodium:proton antiporter NhaD [Gammaproteobacteria bacterium]